MRLTTDFDRLATLAPVNTDAKKATSQTGVGVNEPSRKQLQKELTDRFKLAENLKREGKTEEAAIIFQQIARARERLAASFRRTVNFYSVERLDRVVLRSDDGTTKEVDVMRVGDFYFHTTGGLQFRKANGKARFASGWCAVELKPLEKR